MDAAEAGPVDAAAVRTAADRLTGRVRRTPVMRFRHPAVGSNVRLVLKLEHLQHTGSFKARGALYALLTARIPEAGIVAATGGNHGAAVAWAASRLGCAATIFVPEGSPDLKRRRIGAYGAEVQVIEGSFGDALEVSRGFAAESGALEVHAYDDEAIVAGQGTVGAELIGQVPEATTVLVSCGGGGLYAGIAGVYGRSGRVVPVEPEAAPTLTRALQAGRPTPTEVGGVAVDSLGARQAGRIAFATARRSSVGTVLVTDEAIRQAQRLLWEELRQIAEPGGATALAALVSGRYQPDPDEVVAVVISGANVDPAQVG